MAQTTDDTTAAVAAALTLMYIYAKATFSFGIYFSTEKLNKTR